MLVSKIDFQYEIKSIPLEIMETKIWTAFRNTSLSHGHDRIERVPLLFNTNTERNEGENCVGS